jgi:aryl-alcohol dehydrogenase-like predicted oxidoreductase
VKYTRLGREGAEVSRFALGPMNMGPLVGEDEAFAILDAAREAGVTLLDTADIYGGPPWGERPGQTEQLVGRWLAARKCRDEMVLATKVHGAMRPGRNDRGLSSVHIQSAVDASLRRLGTDRIDLDELDRIWPGPGVAAPEAYAW